MKIYSWREHYKSYRGSSARPHISIEADDIDTKRADPHIVAARDREKNRNLIDEQTGWALWSGPNRRKYKIQQKNLNPIKLTVKKEKRLLDFNFFFLKSLHKAFDEWGSVKYRHPIGAGKNHSQVSLNCHVFFSLCVTFDDRFWHFIPFYRSILSYFPFFFNDCNWEWVFV